MDWRNPVEWFAWIYGKCFQNHAFVGGVVVFALCGAIGGAIGLILYLRGADKYKEAHPDSPQKQVSVEAAGQRITSTKGTGAQSQATSSPKKETPNPKAPANPRGTISAPGMVVQQGGAVSFGQQGGITAGTVNIDQTPPLPSISDDQQSALHTALSAVAKGPIKIVVDIPTEETDILAQRLRAALSADDGRAPDIERVLGVYGPPENCLKYRGIWMIIGENRMEAADAIAVSLVENGVVQGRVKACADKDSPDKLTIVISSN